VACTPVGGAACVAHTHFSVRIGHPLGYEPLLSIQRMIFTSGIAYLFAGFGANAAVDAVVVVAAAVAVAAAEADPEAVVLTAVVFVSAMGSARRDRRRGRERRIVQTPDKRVQAGIAVFFDVFPRVFRYRMGLVTAESVFVRTLSSRDVLAAHRSEISNRVFQGVVDIVEASVDLTLQCIEAVAGSAREIESL
jgi:hypothetical protein